MAESMSGYLQENLLVLLSYYDEQARIIRNTVSSDLFIGDYRQIAITLYNHIDGYHKAPKDDLPILFEDVLKNDSDRKARAKARFYKTILKEIYNNRETVDVKFTMDKLEAFIRYQELKMATLEIAEIVEGEKITEENIEKVETIFSRALKKRASLFDPGTFMDDTTRALAFLQEEEEDIFPTGIRPLDKENLGPRRGELHLLIGLTGKGKTWHLINLGKAALKSGHKVLHISLEMSEKQVSRRYHQALFGIARTPDEILRTGFTVSEGNLERIWGRKNPPKRSFQDSTIGQFLMKKHRTMKRLLKNIDIKNFPTAQLTMSALVGYLDNLEAQKHFVPDLLLLDYPKLMRIDPKNLRIELGRITEELRGLGAERNMAIAAVSQSNRAGESVGQSKTLKVLTMKHISEDFSQSMTADIIWTYNQTDVEKALNLARIHVAKARDQKDSFTVLISQSYETGQFCLRAVRMRRNAFAVLVDHLEKVSEDEEDEELEGNA